jgi:hypothetical protein
MTVTSDKLNTIRQSDLEHQNWDEAVVRLEADVAKIFPTTDAVNEALRFLIRVTQENNSSVLRAQHNIVPEADGINRES